jgi:hypothetical protein
VSLQLRISIYIKEECINKIKITLIKKRIYTHNYIFLHASCYYICDKIHFYFHLFKLKKKFKKHSPLQRQIYVYIYINLFNSCFRLWLVLIIFYDLLIYIIFILFYGIYTLIFQFLIKSFHEAGKYIHNTCILFSCNLKFWRHVTRVIR